MWDQCFKNGTLNMICNIHCDNYTDYLDHNRNYCYYRKRICPTYKKSSRHDKVIGYSIFEGEYNKCCPCPMLQR